MEVLVLGAGRDVGRSCMLLKTSSSQILFDCGAHPGFADARRFPDFSLLNPLSSLDAILISHFHLDHAAALPYLTEKLNCHAPIYMTAPTLSLVDLMLHDFLTTSATRAQFCPFDRADVRACLSRVRLLALGETTVVPAKSPFSVTPYYAGHVLGAVMLHVVSDGHSVLYSGDYSTRADRHLQAADVPYGLRPDLFITEATYCSTVRKDSRKEIEDDVMEAVTAAVANDGKVLVPISAFGRVQAVCGMFAAHPSGDLLKNVPMYIVSGLASKANDLYAGFADWTARNCDEGDQCASRVEAEDGEIQNTHESSEPRPCPFLSQLKPFNRNEHWDLLRGKGSMILFATPGSMSIGLSRDAFHLWAGDSRNLVVVPAFNFSNTLLSKLSSSGDPMGFSGEVKCRLVNMAFNSHTDVRGIVRTCRKVMARAVMLVHGEEKKVVEFRKQLSDALRIECYAPRNGDSVKIVTNTCATKQEIPGSIPSHWEAAINAYLENVVHPPHNSES